MTDDEIKTVVADILGKTTEDAEFEDADVRSEIDYDGDSVIRVIARYKRHPRATPNLLIDSVHAIRNALIAQGEDRFILLTNDVETDRMIEPEEVD